MNDRTHWNTCDGNSLSTNRPSFAAANRVVTRTHLTNERVVQLGRHVTARVRFTVFRWSPPESGWRRAVLENSVCETDRRRYEPRRARTSSRLRRATRAELRGGAKYTTLLLQ